MPLIEPGACLSEELLWQLAHDELSPDELMGVEEHVSQCEQCRSVLESASTDSLCSHEIGSVLKQTDDFRHSQDDDDDLAIDVPRIDSVLRLLGPTDDPNMLGRIGSYEVVGVIGRGGMGVVFKAFDAPLNRFVAIKMLLPHLAESGAARRRFAREGQAAAAVIDDHVLPIYSVAEWQGVPYIVSQFSRGSNLERRIQERGALELKEILRIGLQTARGLAAAHAQGLVHRDVKPSNILLDGTVDRAMLTDFGLARAIDDASITRTGVISGTPQFMSPEQANGEPIDHRSDLFSLGGVLYAMCTGRPPFRSDTTFGVLRRIRETTPRSVCEINPEIPSWLEQIVFKLLEKNTQDRFRSSTELADLLEQCLAHVQQPTNSPLPRFTWKAPSTIGSSSSNGQRQSQSVRRRAITWIAITLLIAGIASYQVFTSGHPARDSMDVSQNQMPAESTTKMNDQAAESPEPDPRILEWNSITDDVNDTAKEIKALEDSAAQDIETLNSTENDSTPSTLRDKE